MTSKRQKWRIPLKTPVDSGKAFFDISVNTGQICIGFEADTPEKGRSGQKVIDEQPKNQLLVNNSFTRSLSESR